MEEVAASKKLANEFEKNFQAHREAFRNSQPEPRQVHDEPEFPELFHKASHNDRVVPRDEDDDQANIVKESSP